MWHFQLSINFVAGEPLQYTSTEGHGTDLQGRIWRFVSSFFFLITNTCNKLNHARSFILYCNREVNKCILLIKCKGHLHHELLTKHEVKIAGYWANSFLFVCNNQQLMFFLFQIAFFHNQLILIVKRCHHLLL